MQNFSVDEFLIIEEIYQDFAATINLLDAWAEKQNVLEVTIVLEKLKAKLNDFKKVIRNH